MLFKWTFEGVHVRRNIYETLHTEIKLGIIVLESEGVIGSGNSSNTDILGY